MLLLITMKVVLGTPLHLYNKIGSVNFLRMVIWSL